MPSLELKIPPPAVTLLAAGGMWLLSSLVAPLPLPLATRITIAAVIACAGVAVDIAALLSFLAARTTVNPWKPASATSLVVAGVFRYSRNPMYLGMLLYLLAWAAYLGSWPALLVLPVFVLYMNRFQIGPEEKVLASLFGAEYAAYKASVRRWL